MTKPLFDSGRGVTVEVNLSPSDGPLFRACRDGVIIATFDHLQEVSAWLEFNTLSPSASNRDHDDDRASHAIRHRVG